MASNDLGGQNECAYDTITAILGRVSKMRFFKKSFGFCMKSVRTDNRTDTFPNYRISSNLTEVFFKEVPGCGIGSYIFIGG